MKEQEEMQTETAVVRPEILEARARVPQHVVHRAFVSETVILNLQTGKYHGVNPVGGRMLEALEKSATVRDAAAIVAAEFERPVEEIELDLCAFCDNLAQRGLIDLHVAGNQS